MAQDLNMVALVKGEERYIFMFTDETRDLALRTVGRFASSKELSLTWYDAAVLCGRMREQSEMPGGRNYG